MPCYNCRKDFDGVSYCAVYYKCRGKTCPDCGKVRKIGWIESIESKNSSNPCVKCKRKTSSWTDKLCGECFLERERKRGCVCFADKDYNKEEGYHSNINYYCPLCEDVHPRKSLCKECFEKQTKHNENRRIFLRVILPSTTVGIIIGFLLGWLFFKKLWKKKKKKLISF